MEGRRDEKTREESLFSPDEPSLGAGTSTICCSSLASCPVVATFRGPIPPSLLRRVPLIREDGVQHRRAVQSNCYLSPVDDFGVIRALVKTVTLFVFLRFNLLWTSWGNRIVQDSFPGGEFSSRGDPTDRVKISWVDWWIINGGSWTKLGLNLEREFSGGVSVVLGGGMLMVPLTGMTIGRELIRKFVTEAC